MEDNGYSATSSGVAAEAEKHLDDEDISIVAAKSGCPVLSVNCYKGKATIVYNVNWLVTLMKASSYGQLKFIFYGEGKPSQKGELPRSYPRSDDRAILYLEKDKKDASDKGGARTRLNEGFGYTLSDQYRTLYSNPKESVEIRGDCHLRDLLIIHKRRYTQTVLKRCGKLKYLQIEDRFPEPELYGQAGPLHSYPMINIYFSQGSNEVLNTAKLMRIQQGAARMMQIMLMAFVNEYLRQHGFPHEAVAREGFGSSIPAISDLGNGVRLDSGLLPFETVDLVVSAIHLLDKCIGKLLDKHKDYTKTMTLLNGFGQEQLSLVDTLNQFALHYTYGGGGEKLNEDSVLALLSSRKGPSELKLPKRFENTEKSVTRIVIDDAPCIPSPEIPKAMKVIADPDDALDGYGSDSDDEFEEIPDEWTDIESKKSKKKHNPQYRIKKAAFISGTAAIRITSACAGAYYKSLSIKKIKRPDEGVSIITGQYFEVETGFIDKGVTHLNIAPNPRNDFSNEALGRVFSGTICTFDVTNATVPEQSEVVLAFFNEHKSAKDPWKILVLQESASKHPTGGDLVYGVVRIVGLKEAVDLFYDVLSIHLNGLNAGILSALTSEENMFRCNMQNMRLMPRNRDLVSCVNNKEPNALGEHDDRSQKTSKKIKNQKNENSDNNNNNNNSNIYN